MKITEAIKTKRLYMDGATGTVLQSIQGLSYEKTEDLCLSAPKIIEDLHFSYLEAGSDIICANTFGVSEPKDMDRRAIISAAYECAKSARERYFEKYGGCDKYVAYDMGPTGKIIGRRGNLSFDTAYEIYAECAKIAKECGFDLIFIETMNDLRETKAALLAVKENCDLPVFVSNAYDASGKMLFGTPPSAAIAMIESMGAHAIGFNCSCGPDLLFDVLKEYEKYSSLPIIAKPNAGLPKVENGRTYFDINEQEFAKYMQKMAESGACILGGCCGTSPEYIRETVKVTQNLPFKGVSSKNITTVSGETSAVTFGDVPVLIGERINPTGKKRIKEALKNKDYSLILSEGVRQQDAGVHMLDVNAGLPDIDEGEALLELTLSLQEVCSIPLQIDSANPAAMEKALRYYVGKPLINSVNASEASMSAVFPMAKRYGGAIIALTMDENGIPATAKERFELAKRIADRAKEYGIEVKDLIFDPLTMTVSSDQNSAKVTLEALRLIKENLGANTSLGVSNVSFGLPERDMINASFFTLAMSNGLSAAIMNPFSAKMMEAYTCYLALTGKDTGMANYIDFAMKNPISTTQNGVKSEIVPKNDEKTDGLGAAVLKGLTNSATELAKASVIDPMEIINRELIPALNTAGEQFSSGKMFLPQLLMCADAASAVFAVLKEKMPVKTGNDAKKIVMATVKGDIHDIGKNIVCTLLESFGYEVIDLGRDVDEELIAEKCKKEDVKLLGLSALMTTTVPSMESTVRLVKERCPSTRIMVGGAVLTEELAQNIGADFYAAAAIDAVNIAKKVF